MFSAERTCGNIYKYHASGVSWSERDRGWANGVVRVWTSTTGVFRVFPLNGAFGIRAVNAVADLVAYR